MGFLANLDVPAAADTLLFTVVAAGTVNLRWCNRGAAPVKVRCAVTQGGAAPAAKDWVDYDVGVLANGILEDTGFPVSVGERIYVNTNIATVSVRLMGV